ncbi:MAG: hypothetical protein KBD37_00225 [Burkholderiales bacterium]|nr:hypothetical protein [Burkholderiales bacterium]
MNTKTFLRFFTFLKRLSTTTCPKLRLQSMEVFKDEKSERPYVFVSPIGKYQPHKIFLEDLLDQDKLLKKLDFPSVCYVFHAYGVLRASENNDIYCLTEIMPFNNVIKVKNNKTFLIEEWDKDKFDIDYMFLDKKSLRIATEFFSNTSKIKPTIPGSHHANTSDTPLRNTTLRLVK